MDQNPFVDANRPEEKEREGELFDQGYYSEGVFRWWIEHPYRLHTLRHLVRFLKEERAVTNEELRVLEPACGCGVNLTNLARAFPDFKMVGVDVSSEGLATGNQFGVGSYEIGDAENLPFENEEFDICVCVAAAHHFSRDPRRFVWEMCRVLKPGGTLYLFEPCQNCRIPRWLRPLELAAKAILRALVLNREFTGYGAIPHSPSEGAFLREQVMESLLESGMHLIEHGYSEYMTEWARHLKRGFWIARLFDRLVPQRTPLTTPDADKPVSRIGGNKYYAILEKSR